MNLVSVFTNSWEQTAVHWEWMDRLSLNNHGQVKLVSEAKMKKSVCVHGRCRTHKTGKALRFFQGDIVYLH